MTLQIYKVGGAVRDQLLGIEATDNDYVVVGSSKAEMLALGFIEVGRDFPVFLHPTTHEEYALARRDKKTGAGYHGFEFDTSSQITLEDDLLRRDITINAMALDENGNVIDPFNGQQDLEHKIIRHVSAAFSEDPLRVLRAARFSAQLDFSVAPETLQLMQHLVVSGELSALSSERVWMEINKALMTAHIGNFFIVLHRVDALAQVLPGLEVVMQDASSKLEFLNLLSQIATDSSSYSLAQRFAIVQFYAMWHTASPITQSTPKPLLPAYASANNQCKQLATLLLTTYAAIANLKQLNSSAIDTLIRRLDPIRSPQRYAELCSIIQLISKTKLTHTIEPNLHILSIMVNKIKQIDYKAIVAQHNKVDLEVAIKQIKLDIIEELL